MGRLEGRERDIWWLERGVESASPFMRISKARYGVQPARRLGGGVYSQFFH